MRWIVWLTVLAGCDDTLFGVAKDGGSTTDPTETSDGFCAVQRIFAADCLACHSAGAKLGGLDLETDPIATLVGQPSIAYAGTLVVAGDPDASLLFHKVAGTQAGDQGGVMPPGAGLDPAGVEAIRSWIADGASAACGTTPTGTGYHPDDFASGAVHGLEAKLQVQACTTCHGADLTGGTVGVSCDSCHAEITTDWRTNCTFCHGGANGDTTGAPPENIDDTTSPIAFAPHQTHVHTGLRATLDCVECHQKPTDVLSAGHLFVDDTTAAVAEVTFLGVSQGGGWTPGGGGGGGNCTVYCHGDGRGTGVVTETSGPKTCTSCHAAMTSNPNQWGGMSGEHEKHLADVGATCATCHPTTTDNTTIAQPDLHINGQPDVAITNGGTVVWDGDSCAGSCHFQAHFNEPW